MIEPPPRALMERDKAIFAELARAYGETGGGHSLGGRSDGTIVTWGWNIYGQCDIPAPNADFVAVAAGGNHSLGLKHSDLSAVDESEPFNMPGAAMLQIVSLACNPANPFTEFLFETRRAGLVSMEVYDGSGRRVKTVALGILGPGRHCAQWDGCDESGVDLGSGVYFVRLRGIAGDSRAVKVLLVR